MAIRTELNLRLPNSPGALAGVCRVLSDNGVNILALSLETGGQLRLVVDNHVHAAGILGELHHRVTAREVLLLAVSNAPGSLTAVLTLLADAGINVDYAYGGGSDRGPSATVIAGVADTMRAAAAAGV